MILLDSKPNLFKLRLASKKNIFFISIMIKMARIYVIVNKHKMYLDKMSIQKMEFSASIWDSSMFYFMAKIIIPQTCNRKIWAKINSLNTLLIVNYNILQNDKIDYLVETLVEAGVWNIYAITGDSLDLVNEPRDGGSRHLWGMKKQTINGI
jgi:hypothetical protein